MNQKYLRVLSYILVAALAVGMTLGATAIYRRRNPDKLEAIEKLIQERFIGESNKSVLEDAAANAMIQSLGDRWSYYIPADNFESYAESVDNSYVGVGITIRSAADGSGLLVEAVKKGGPADLAGIMVDDVIVSIDGTSTEGMTSAEARELVSGKEGSKVNMTVLRHGEGINLFITRGKILTPVATGVMLTEEIGLVTISNFETRCAEETICAIEDLVDQGAKALLFDVRNNPGGAADELIKILDYLLPEGEIFHTVDYTGKEDFSYSDDNCVNLPMAVLVNERSYSAAEFFAATLSEYNAAKVVGVQTCGKGYFQVVYRLHDGSAVGLSIGKYFTPNGESLANVGLTPDIEVAVDDETAQAIYNQTIAQEEDPQLGAALNYLLEVRQRKKT